MLASKGNQPVDMSYLFGWEAALTRCQEVFREMREADLFEPERGGIVECLHVVEQYIAAVKRAIEKKAAEQVAASPPKLPE